MRIILTLSFAYQPHYNRLGRNDHFEEFIICRANTVYFGRYTPHTCMLMLRVNPAQELLHVRHGNVLDSRLRTINVL